MYPLIAQSELASERRFLHDMEESKHLWHSIQKASQHQVERHAALCAAQTMRLMRTERRAQVWGAHKTREVVWEAEYATGAARRVALR
jgi:hypothetical protein